MSVHLPALSEDCDIREVVLCFGINWEIATIEEIQKVNASGKDGLTPLHYAARYNTNPEVRTFLLENGADIDAKNGAGQTALDAGTLILIFANSKSYWALYAWQKCKELPLFCPIIEWVVIW